MKKNVFKNVMTVTMSLAMVLSAMPNTLDVKATDLSICTDGESQDAVCGRELYFAISELLEINDFNGFTLDSSEKISVNGVEMNVLNAINLKNKELNAFRLGLAGEKAYESITEWLKAVNAIKEMYTNGFEKITNVEEEAGLVKDIADKIVLGEVWNPKSGNVTTSELRNMKTALNKMREFDENYKDALSDDLLTRFENVYFDLEYVISDYVDEGEELADFVLAFEKILENDYSEKETKLTASEAFITGYSTTVPKISLSSKTDINNRINKIKKAYDYNAFKYETEVEYLIEEYENILDSVTSLGDLTKNESFRAYERTKTADEGVTVKEFLEDLDISAFSDSISKATALSEVKDILKVLDGEQYKILQNLVKNVVEKTYNSEVKKYGNVYVDKSDWKTGINTSERSRLSKLPAVLFMMVDNNTGETGWELIEKHMSNVSDAIDAVTKDIEKLTTGNLKASDGKLINLAYDAIFELTEGGDFEKNLTSKEKKSMRRAETQVNALKTAYEQKGFASKTGWSDKGNGNWTYTDESGKVVTKWVAAGKDWYYVKGGNMLRNSWIASDSTGSKWYYVDNAGKMVTNTVINGYKIDTNGIWIK